ncbi:MAG: DUF4956 domain-containing protein [Sumerlaeia bacterium]
MNTVTDFLNSVPSPLGAPGIATILASLLFALFVGQAIAWVYLRTHSGASYSRSFVQSLVLIAIIVTLVMVIVGNNVVVAFGLIGALAVIRFRNVLKDTRDTAYIFMELAVGLGSGTGNFKAVLVGALVFGAVMFYMSVTEFGSRHLHDALLRFEATVGENPAFEPILDRHCLKAKVVSQRSDVDGVMDYAFELVLRDPGRSSELVEDLRLAQGIGGVSLLMETEQSEV